MVKPFRLNARLSEELFLRDELRAAWCRESAASGREVAASQRHQASDGAGRGRVPQAVDNAAADPFAIVAGLDGEVYREVASRRTFRFEILGASYFAKVHAGVGWPEILKNLMTLRMPVLGAENEFRACRHLAEVGVRAPTVAAYGRRGMNPAKRFSFIVCDALENYVSLEDFTETWATDPPSAALKAHLIDAVADLAGVMHRAGVNHRDFYICHILLHKPAFAAGNIELAIIDLHRAVVRPTTPARWLYRDLAALLYSTLELGLTDDDRRRFVARYTGVYDKHLDRRFWRRVVRRARRLERKGRAP